MKLICRKVCLAALLSACLSGVQADAVADDEDVAAAVIVLIGDSTVCEYPQASRQRGWGEMLPLFLADDTQVVNQALGGASTKTFPAERWERTLALKPDFVLIQFGHNDSHRPGKPESTDAGTEYRENLRRYVRQARAAGIEPVLVTPVRRRLFKDGHPTTELEPYACAMRELAAEERVLLLDLYASSGWLYDRLGEKRSVPLTMNKPDEADRVGVDDRTHFTAAGAVEMARLVARAMADTDPRLAVLVDVEIARE
jgi:lysophospholipase L1-like esterase